MLLSKRIHVILILIFLLVLFGCKENVTSSDSDPVGILSSYDGCKTFTTASSSGSSSHGNNEECVAYDYDGEGLLVLWHINSGFNCCPAKITADVFVSGNMIYIQEKEQEQGCFCRCLFDVRYEIYNLEPGQYTLEIKGLYVEDADDKLMFSVQLLGSCSGTLCVSRTHYPWNTPN